MKKYLFVLIFIGLIAGGGLAYASNRSQNTVIPIYKPAAVVAPLNNAPKPVVLSVQNMISIVNDYRAKAGLAPLKESVALDTTSAQKCQQMLNDKLFGHEDKSGVHNGLAYLHNITPKSLYRGENLLNWDVKSDQDVIDRWYNETGHEDDGETGHRDNILSPNYKVTGLSYCTTKTANPSDTWYMIVEHFAS